MLKTQSRTARKTQPIRRHIQHLSFINGVHFFTCKSMTRGFLPTVHAQEIDIDTGEAHCSCEDFRFNRAKHEPTLATPDNLCKHLKRCARWLEDHDEMPDLSKIGAHRCIHCGMPDAKHEICDERGHASGEHYCADCLRIARMMNGGSTPREAEPVADDSELDAIPESAPEYEPEIQPDYEPEYSEEAQHSDYDDFDARR